jgi:ribose transport system substrate-binding protein
VKMRWPKVAVLPVAAVLMVSLAACGSSDNASKSGSSGGAASKAVASVPTPITTPPKTVGVTEPLKSAPAKGKTFFWLQCEVPICGKITTGVKAATAALGWNYQSQVFKSADPGAGIESALQRKPDVIGTTGIPSAAVKTQLAAAAKAGIPVVTCGAPEQPSSSTYAAICGATTQPDGVQEALWAIRDSGGNAHVVNVTIPSYPLLKTNTDGTASTLKKYCPKCTSDNLNLTVDDLAGGQVAPKLIGYLQSHPNVNYVMFTFADLASGIPEALRAAGLSDKVTLVGNGGGEAQFKAVAGGAHQAWVAYPAVLEGWQMVDAAARLLSGGLPAGYQQQLQHLPTYIVDKPGAAKALAPGFDWPAPAGYQEQFKKLWKVG